MTETKRLYRSRNDRVLTGVCGGLGAYLNLDPTIVRVLAVILVLFTFPVGLIVYLVLALVVPEEPVAAPPAPAQGGGEPPQV